MDQQGEREQADIVPFRVEKLEGWKRKLLDLGSRANPLLNARVDAASDGKLLPLVTCSLATLEDALQSGKSFVVQPYASLDAHEGVLAGTCSNAVDYGIDAARVADAFQAQELLSPLDQKRLTDVLQGIAKSARSAREETGANTLFLALGMLRWFEKDERNPDDEPAQRHAPLVLLPVDLERPSVRSPYRLSMRDEGPVMNSTLLERMKREPSCGVPLWDPSDLPVDAAGLDIQKILDHIADVARRRNAETADGCEWTVVPCVFLGEFSFSQFDMWNDLHTNPDVFVAHPIVGNLMGAYAKWDVEPLVQPEHTDEQGVFLTLPTDSSQLFAIRKAAEGRSFALFGPPGTGKSQTIAALIANAMGQGKTVLFVAEKKVALEVVKRRLDAMGLGAFCLELHSNKASRATVLDQLQEAIDSASSGTEPDAFAEQATRLAEARAELDEYAVALHETRDCGLSLYTMISRYMDVADAPVVDGLASSLPEGLGTQGIDRLDQMVAQLVAAGEYLYRHPAEHLLGRTNLQGYDRSLRNRLPKLCEDCLKGLDALEVSARALVDGLDAQSMYAKPGDDFFDTLDKVAHGLENSRHLPAACFAQGNPTRLLSGIESLAKQAQELEAVRSNLLLDWTEDVLDFDAQTAAEELACKTGVQRTVQIHKLATQMGYMTADGSVPSDVEKKLSAICGYQRKRAAVQRGMARLGIDEAWDIDWSTYAQSCRDALKGGSALLSIGSKPVADARLEPAAAAYLAARETWANASGELFRATGLEQGAQLSAGEWFADRRELIGEFGRACGDMREWAILADKASQCREAGLGAVVDAYMGGLAAADVVPAFRRALYQALADRAMTQSGLDSFLGCTFQDKIDRFRELDARSRDLAREEILFRLAAGVPAMTTGGELAEQVGVLQKALAGGCRGMSLRSLFSRIPDLLPRLAPVMLLSPMSVARYLDLDGPKFDLVVFDEASQITTAKAVGAIVRGKAAIVVGDPNQMPPSTLFSSNTAVDEADPMLEDLPSILDDCLAMGMPRTHLLWHYRSRHEGLIAFSNVRFYGGKLKTFPSADERCACVTATYVGDALYERGVNKAEAARLVEEVVRIAGDPQTRMRSVGIVTFNKPQMDYVENLLERAYARDAQLEMWAGGNAPDGPSEPLFVKNIETVQGDERDIVLLGLTHGPDASGKVSMNFGNFNWEGGWRRLNVAITRARHRMEVFSSFTPEQMDSVSESVQALRDFLVYARSGVLPQTAAGFSGASAENGLASWIAGVLARDGYEAVCGVGCSSFKVDVAVVDPRDSDRYVLAVLLDSPVWGGAGWVRDRDVSRPAILESLGWNIWRTWAPDWYDNGPKEAQRLLDELDRLVGPTKCKEPAACGRVEA